MAILEPVLSETMLGHPRVELAIAFQEKEGARFSGGALKAIERAKPVLCQPDWKRAFAPEAIAESVRRITDPSS